MEQRQNTVFADESCEYPVFLQTGLKVGVAMSALSGTYFAEGSVWMTSKQNMLGSLVCYADFARNGRPSPLRTPNHSKKTASNELNAVIPCSWFCRGYMGTTKPPPRQTTVLAPNQLEGGAREARESCRCLCLSGGEGCLS